MIKHYKTNAFSIFWPPQECKNASKNARMQECILALLHPCLHPCVSMYRQQSLYCTLWPVAGAETCAKSKKVKAVGPIILSQNGYGECTWIANDPASVINMWRYSWAHVFAFIGLSFCVRVVVFRSFVISFVFGFSTTGAWLNMVS